MLLKLKTYIKKYAAKKNIDFLGKNVLVDGTIQKRFAGGIISVGDDSWIQGILVAETALSNISIGNNVFIGGATLIDCVQSIRIEDDVLVSYGCVITDSDNHSISYSIRKNDLSDWRAGGFHDWKTTKTRPVLLSKGVWIGANSMILKGVSIGEGSVVGAGSVVTKNVPPYTIVAGNPAKIIREIPPDER